LFCTCAVGTGFGITNKSTFHSICDINLLVIENEQTYQSLEIDGKKGFLSTIFNFLILSQPLYVFIYFLFPQTDIVLLFSDRSRSTFDLIFLNKLLSKEI